MAAARATRSHLAEWMTPPKYFWISLLMATGGFLFGLDTGTIGPVSSMASFQEYISSSSPTIHGLIVSSILIPAATASFFAGHLADRVGRPKGVIVGALIYGLGAAIESATIHIAMFFVGRIIEGVGEGLFLSTVVTYICEISPANRRGLLTCLSQFGTTFGIFLGYFVALGTVRINSSASWRIPLALQAVFSFSFAAGCLLVPESPRWLEQNNRHEDAERVWSLLGVSRDEVEGMPLETTPGQGGASSSSGAQELQAPAKSATSAVQELVPTPAHGPDEPRRVARVGYLRMFDEDVRGRTILAGFLLWMQQMSGIDGVLYFAPLLFKQAGLTTQSSSFLASGLSAIVIMVVTIPGVVLADKWGRRTSAITGGLGMGVCMILIGSLYAADAVHATSGPARWLVVATIYIFAAIFSVTWALCFKPYVTEIQPPATRAAAASFAQSMNWLSNFLVALITPIILARSSSAVYFIFGAAALLTSGVCIVYMRETRGKALESIDESFRHGPGDLIPSSLPRRLRWKR